MQSNGKKVLNGLDHPSRHSNGRKVVNGLDHSS
jgi:hypothetical protein